jgi:hypothetical protein
MNTKYLMTSSSLVLGLAGVFALFAPDVLLVRAGVSISGQLPVLVQLMGGLYFSLALMNWTAKDSAIGGVYARPVSIANFTHFFSGALVLARYHLSDNLDPFLLSVLVVYTIFAILFYWLVFRHTGIAGK